MKRVLIADLATKLWKSKLIKSNGSESEFVESVIQESKIKDSPIRDALVMDLLEFGRAIHAEMSAISDAARLGLCTKLSTLYCTTFPCHMCAKHIIASGISKVVYIEPYPKSYAEHLHKEIVVGVDSVGDTKVQFSPFIGVAPLRFRDLYERGRRKDGEGHFSEWAGGKSKPMVHYTVATYIQNETAMAEILRLKIADLTAKKQILVVK